jgi:hypothetical protein
MLDIKTLEFWKKKNSSKRPPHCTATFKHSTDCTCCDFGHHNLLLLLYVLGWWQSFFKLVIIVSFYFTSSIALTFYQKDLIQRIPYPLSIVIVHLIIKFLLAGLCRYTWSRFTGENRVVLGTLKTKCNTV